MFQRAFVFPGQGSHFVGMGKDVYAAFPVAREIFQEADATLGFPLTELCFNGPAEELTDTVNQQPALLTVSVALLESLKANGAFRGAEPRFCAGHSLGEYTALVAAGALDFSHALRLVRERGRLMKEAGEKTPGGMAAILGLEDRLIEEICRVASEQAGGPGVVCANYNAPGQIVISGQKEAVEIAIALAKERGAKRVIPLAITIASHSPLMAEAARRFAEAVAATPIRDAIIPVVANVTGQPITTVAEIRQELVQQLTSPVRWTASVQHMVAQGVGTFYEIGPKDVLTGLIRRIAPEATAVPIGTAEAVRTFSQGGKP